MLAQGLAFPNKRRSRKLDCLAAALITAVAGCGVDHPTFPEPTPDLAWQLNATYSDGYGVRSIWGDPSGEVFALSAGVLHYDGSTWSKTTLLSELSDIWGNSADDVFAVGSSGSIFHYDGKVWTAMTTPTSQGLHAVWGSASYDQ